MARSPCTSKDGLKKGPWSPEEDEQLIDYINKHGHGSWQALPKRAGLTRCGKSCRLRWTNYLRPDIKRGRFSDEEEEAIINLHSIHGNKWSTIASHLHGRTDNEIKNYWNTHLRKKLIRSGLNPQTHEPIYDFNLLATLSQLQSILNLCNLINPMDSLIMMNQIASPLLPIFQETPLFPTSSVSSNLPPTQLDNLITRSNLEYCLGLSNIANNNNAYPFSNGVQGDSNLESSVNNINIVPDCKLPPLVSSSSRLRNLNGMESFGNDEIYSFDDESSFFDSLESIVDNNESNSFLRWC
ncbi:hypothetical protein Leryth_027548 [Lithospermum erythrorhizon]|nr:hypothetical protein Leryth_027548 [Lithospermum erythrorhizon]